MFTDGDRIVKRIHEDIAPRVAVDPSYWNAKKNMPGAARIELDAALMRVMAPLLKDNAEFYKQLVENPSFKRFVTDLVQELTKALLANYGRRLPDSVPIDPDLAALIGAWPALPAAVRRRIMAMTRDGE